MTAPTHQPAPTHSELFAEYRMLLTRYHMGELPEEAFDDARYLSPVSLHKLITAFRYMMDLNQDDHA